jgi:hypothetical protein
LPECTFWLVLCERGDRSAQWVYEGLVARAPCRVELVVSEALAYAPLWDHRLGDGHTSTEIRLADGRVIRSAEVTAVLNRLGSPPVEHLNGAAQTDRDYASQELYALWLSWLETLECPVINRATPTGLSGPWLDRSEWCSLAARVGLSTVPYACASTEREPVGGASVFAMWPDSRPAALLSVAGTVIGDHPPMEIVKGARRLGAAAAVDLLGLEFLVDGDGAWRFLAASPMPDLIWGGAAVRERLAAELSGDAS